MWWDPVQPGTPSEPILIKRGSDNMAERKEGEEEEGEEEGLKLTCMPFGVTWWNIPRVKSHSGHFILQATDHSVQYLCWVGTFP